MNGPSNIKIKVLKITKLLKFNKLKANKTMGQKEFKKQPTRQMSESGIKHRQSTSTLWNTTSLK